jgi:hypothetical protein
MPVMGMSQERNFMNSPEEMHQGSEMMQMTYALKQEMVFYGLIIFKKGCILWNTGDWDVLACLFHHYVWEP